MSKQLEHESDGSTVNPSKLVCKKCKQTYTYQTLGSFGCLGYPTDTNQASELSELCQEVYKRTGWEAPDTYKAADGNPENDWQAYDSDYLLEKLPEDVRIDKDSSTTYTASKFFFGKNSHTDDIEMEASTPLKALLKLTIALSEAGELK